MRAAPLLIFFAWAQELEQEGLVEKNPEVEGVGIGRRYNLGRRQPVLCLAALGVVGQCARLCQVSFQ